MSTWNLGKDDVSEETRALRDKLASKDGQIAAQHDQLAKRAAEHDEMVERLNELMHKLTTETQRALRLEADLKQRTEDLSSEKIASHNANAALATALDKGKEYQLEIRQLEATLERVSHTVDEDKAVRTRVETEKAKLEARVRELESDLMRQTSSTPATRPRSSSTAHFRITALEHELKESKSLASSRETQLNSVSQKLAQAQADLIKAQNEQVANERKWTREVADLEARLEEKEEELSFFRGQNGGMDEEREEELLKRIDEDAAKIAALELMLGGAEDSQKLKERLRRVDAELKEERQRLATTTQERDEALDDLDAARNELDSLVKELNERKERDHALGQRAVASLEACEKAPADRSMDLDTMDPAPLRLPSPPKVSPVADADTVAHVERLLAAVDRLRAERDTLRHDVQFLESESRFAIEALEAKLSQSISTANNTENHAAVGQLQAEMDDMHAQMRSYRQQYSVNLDRKNRDIQRLGLQVQALSIALGHISPQVDQLIDSLELSESTRGRNLATISQESLLNSVSQYDVTQLNLQTVTGERDHLLLQLQNVDKQWEQEVDSARMAEQELAERLAEAERDIDELNGHIDTLESENDSLRLQVTNLTTDLENAQNELTNAESRYTNLQFHQLNTMTSNEATRTLREHIEELEGRVLRRTEQIGIHQHDIRRLETNLRLQEERLNEMGNELEMMAAQKSAMVEDCADAREARNEAQARAEALEEEIETVEERAKEEMDALTKRSKEEMEALVKHNQEEVEVLEARHKEDKALVTTLITVIADTITSARAGIRAAKSQAAKLQDALSGDQEHSSDLQKELDEKIAGLLSLTKESEEQRAEIENIRISLSESQSELSELTSLAERLQDEKAKLEAQVSDLLEAAPEAMAGLEAENEELLERVEELKESESAGRIAEQGIAKLKHEHAKALADLERRLEEAEQALAEVQGRYDASSEEHSRAREEAEAAIGELEKKLEESTKSLADLQALHAQASAHDEEHTSRVSELQDLLAKSEAAHQDALKSLEEFQVENTRLADELARTHDEQESLISRAVEDQEVAKQELENKVLIIQGRFEEETRLLNMSNEEVAHLTTRLQEVSEKLSSSENAHAAFVATVDERAVANKAAAEELHAELARLQQNLTQTLDKVSMIEEERNVLQQEITVHEAEAQKSRSLVRYLEGQVKDNDQLVSALKQDIQRVQADLARSEKACKAAEVNLSLQNAQHKRETTELQKELSAFRVRPNVEQALAELEERNTEMEDLLRAKCAEIEENDDRVLEMLKEKKKLTTKVESLTRKVQNLQAKLAAAKASTPVGAEPLSAGPSSVQSPPSIPTVTSPITSMPQTSTSHAPLPRSSSTLAFNPPTAKPVVPTPPSQPRRSSRGTAGVAGPSSIQRPKTPEARSTMPVFRAKTPERRHVPEESMVTEVVIGKKRSAPDDFDGCENIPAQAFTVDAEDVENKTPRVRRVLNSLQSGFTPLRNQNLRPTSNGGSASPRKSVASPRKSAAVRPTPSYMSDMTNGQHDIPQQPAVPSSAKQSSKRSWLGKIRGSSNPTERNTQF